MNLLHQGHGATETIIVMHRIFNIYEIVHFNDQNIETNINYEL